MSIDKRIMKPEAGNQEPRQKRRFKNVPSFRWPWRNSRSGKVSL
jgi:hypothetical protein